MTPKYKSSDEEFMAAVLGAISYTEISKRLGLRDVHVETIRARIEKLGIATPELVGRKGVSHDPRSSGHWRKTIEMLTDNGSLRRRMIHEGIPEKCSHCGLNRWCGEHLPLEVDHRDGNPKNNALSNLRFLCPNCHAQTPTWRGRNRKNRKVLNNG